MKADRPFLEHILDSITAIEEFVAPGPDILLHNRMARDATIRNFEIIGEAARNLSDEAKDASPDVPWTRIIAFRNRLAHGYWGVDLSIVTDVIANELPVLKSAVEALLAKQG
jgi:uncharacterized protein with HEPN domain